MRSPLGRIVYTGNTQGVSVGWGCALLYIFHCPQSSSLIKGTLLRSIVWLCSQQSVLPHEFSAEECHQLCTYLTVPILLTWGGAECVCVCVCDLQHLSAYW